MFDLFRSRTKAVRYLLIALLSLVALSMVVTLIPGFGSTMGGRSEQVIAEVGDEILSARMVHQAIQVQMRNQGGLTRETVGIFAPEIIQRMVGELATAYQAEKMGFTVSEAELAEGIRMMIPQLFQGGQFVGKEVYQQFLMQQNVTIPEFENNVRKTLLMGKLQGMVFQGVVVTPKEVEDEFKKNKEKVKLAIAKFDPEEYEKQFKPTRDELEAHLKARPQMFVLPAKRTVSVLVADEKKLGEAITVDEAALRQAYGSQKDRFRVEERVHVRHILIKNDANTPKEETAKIRAKAEDLLKKVRGGADFAALAKEHSEDPGSASKGGDYWIVRGQTVPEFEAAAFKLQPNQFADLVTTQFGFHIMQGLGKEVGRLKPYEEVREELALEGRRRQLFDRMPTIAEQARAELEKAPGQGQQIAQKYNLLYGRTENAGTGTPLPIVGLEGTDLDYAIASLAKGGVSQVVQLPQNRLAFAVVEDIIPPKPATLADVEERVRKSLAGEKGRELSESKAKEFQAAMFKNGNDILRTGKDLGVKVIETNEFDRSGQIEGIGPAAFFGEQPFVYPEGHVIGIYRAGGVPHIIKIMSKSPADPGKLKDERDTLVTSIRERKLRERRELFEEGLVRSLTEGGKVKVYDDAVKRLVASYGS